MEISVRDLVMACDDEYLSKQIQPVNHFSRETLGVSGKESSKSFEDFTRVESGKTIVSYCLLVRRAAALNRGCTGKAVSDQNRKSRGSALLLWQS
ncbi:hypothetical protein EVAR_94378_1 [Eumeta japonica]|uniref:Uncharacterized protein n=1 Tax=Eumeta variegata TaxID=151549 RepID=A0A4C1TQ09_EUMVA|nr:hypothetical protein EVAR_94378_1 [Eumeta japonica]